jgi:hypothetical protein
MKKAFFPSLAGNKVAADSLRKSAAFTSELTLPLPVSCATNDTTSPGMIFLHIECGFPAPTFWSNK